MVSFRGLKQDHPAAFGAVKEGYLKIEAYEMLYILETLSDSIDDKFFFFVQLEDNYPVVFPRQDYYSREQYESICDQTSIPLKEADKLLALSP